MKITTKQLKQLIREELSKTLNEENVEVEKIEKTTVFDAEALMRPGLRVNTFKNTLDIDGNPKDGASKYKLYKVTLSDDETILAQVDGNDLKLYDLEDYLIDDEALKAKVAAAIKNLPNNKGRER